MQSKKKQSTLGRISVIMPCFNAGSFIAEAVDCVLNQTYSNVELIVVDDGSTDNSRTILQNYSDRIKIIFQNNQGPGPARNRGIEAATGEFVAFLDADDYWDTRFLELLHSALSHSNASVSYCGWQNIGKNKTFPPYIPPNYEKGDKAQDFLKSAAPWPIHAALVRRNALDEVGSFDEQWATCMDYDLWLRLATTHQIVLVPEVLAFYRHHGTGQITSKEWRQAENVLKVKFNFIKTHREIVKHFSTRQIQELTYGAYLRRGYNAYWKRDLISAHKIFRQCIFNRYFSSRDVKYLLPALLPEYFYITALRFLDNLSIQKIKNFVIKQKCIPWGISKRYNDWLEKNIYFNHPFLYQLIKYRRTKKTTFPLTSGPKHHFFGYYDKTPWNKSGNKILAHSVAFNDRPPNSDDVVDIGYIIPDKPDSFTPISETRAWNWQQGAMLQWHPLYPDSKIFFNDRVNDKFVAICHDIETKSQVIIERPIYALSPTGDYAFSLNFARLHNHRPGYGYTGINDVYAELKAPAEDGIFSIDLKTGESKLIISLAQLAQTNPSNGMKDTYHWVNHIQICPSGERFAFFHIWYTSDKNWSVRLYTANKDGRNLSCLLDTGDISHYDWKDDNTILVWAKHPTLDTNHFLLCDLAKHTVNIVCKERLKEDGHCSFSPNREWIINDTYPNYYDHRTLMLIRTLDQKVIELNTFHSPKKSWWGEIRCDLHPRWNREGNKVCIDSVHSGTRQMYMIDLQGII